MLRKLSELLLFIVCVVVVSALLAPLAYGITEALWPGMWPFRRVFNRCIMIAALVLLWPLAKCWGIRSWKDVGFSQVGGGVLYLKGIVIGIVTVSLLFVAHLVSGIMSWSWTLEWKHFWGFLFSAVAIGILEELLFRGMLFYALREQMGKKIFLWAILVSCFYAAAHFIEAHDPAGAVTWKTGFELWGGALPDFIHVQAVAERWFSLVLVGLILSVVAVRFGGIWLSAGLHSGWVLTLKLSDKMSEVVPDRSHLYFGVDLITGIIPVAFLFVCLVVAFFWRKRA